MTKTQSVIEEISKVARLTGKMELLGELLDRGWISVEQSKELSERVRKEHLPVEDMPKSDGQRELEIAEEEAHMDSGLVKCPIDDWVKPLEA